MKRTRRSAHEWEEIVGRWRASGLSARAFAAQHELKSSTLSWWRAQLGKRSKPQAAPVRAAKSTPPGFTQLRVVSAAQPGGQIEVISSTGLIVRVQGVVDEQALVRVLRAVSQC